MFLEKLIISNIWNSLLICIMLGLKHLFKDKLSLRFQYYSWYVLLGSLVLFFLPDVIWPETCYTKSITRQTFSISSSTNNTPTILTPGDAWLRDTTELISSPTNNYLAFTIITIWLIGVLILLGTYWYGSYKLKKIKHFASEPSKDVQKQFEACLNKLELKGNVHLSLSRFITVPMSFGWKKAFVVLPLEGMDAMTTTELNHVLLHELTHIKHGDLVTNYLFCGIQSLYWFNPFIWMALSQMRRDREAYCDWAVISELKSENERLLYGQTILNFANASKAYYHTANGLCQGKAQLKYRLQQIVCFKRETKPVRFLGRCFAATLALVAIGQIPILAYCAETSENYYKPAIGLKITEIDYSRFFNAVDGCAVIYDLNADRYIVSDKQEATRRVPPCSTYKIYSALNALEQGIISPEENTIAWDGTQYGFEYWNQEQTLLSAMQNSVNWYFSILDQVSGQEQMEAFFREIEYGDCELGGDSDSYWNGSGVKISALEQINLLLKLYRNDFDFDPANVATVRNALALTESGLYGKTGTGRFNGANIAGWFVGYVETLDNTYFVAVYLCSDDADGAAATEIAVEILKEMGIELTYPI